jgi:hypothetical protein
MSGIRALSKIQLGKETTAGTIIAATTIWRGMGSLEDSREVMFPEENVGYISGTDRTYVAKLQAALAMDSVEATFEQVPHIMNAGIKTVAAVRDGSGSAYAYTYTFPTTAPNTIKTYTIEGGDNQAAEVMEHSFVEKFTLEGKSGESWMISADWLGRQVAPQAFTGSVALPTVEEMLFGKTKIYIDPVSGNFGATLKSMTLLAAKLDVTTGLIPKFTADGYLYFSFVQSTMPEVMLELTFEHDATSVAEIVNWKAETPRLIRLLCEGSTFTTAGTTYSKKTMIIDLAGKWEKIDPLDDQDGNSIRVGTFRARYDATKAAFGEIKFVNALTALP